MKIGRFDSREMSLSRILRALIRRLRNQIHWYKWKHSSLYLENQRILKSLSNIHSGETCILMANGPSLNRVDLGKHMSVPKIGLNRIYLSNDPSKMPDYLVCVNKVLINQYYQEIMNVKAMVFLDYQARGVIQSHDKVLLVGGGLFTKEFSVDISDGMYVGPTVTYAALQLAFHLGFMKVVIVGLDHNYHFEGGVNEMQSVDTDMSNHFIKNYFPVGTKWETPDISSSEYFYSKANDYFLRHGREIVDCTDGGKCQIFRKSNINDEIS